MGLFRLMMPQSDTPGKDLRRLRDRIPRHWRGETTLAESITHCVVMVFLPIITGFTLGIALGLMTSQGVNAFETSLQFGAFTSLLAVGWWCKGMFTLTNRLLSNQRLTAALLSFVMAFTVAWQLAATVIELAAENLAAIGTKRDSLSKVPRSWEDQPAKVLAIPELGRFLLTGDIGWGSAKALRQAIEAHPDIRLLELESNGGFVHEAAQIDAIIESHHLDTLVRGRCYSACTDIFLAGIRRFVGHGAKLGFHQSGYPGRPRDTVWDIPEYGSSITFRAKGISDDFAEIALNTSYYSAWYPHVYDVKRSGFATHWWSDRPPEYQ